MLIFEFMKNITLCLFASILFTAQMFAHPSAKDHFKDMSAVFDGYGGDKNFKELADVVSAGIDDHLKIYV